MDKKPKKPIIRQIYLYIFTILGLVLLTIGSVGFIDMALKTWVFTEADKQQRMWDAQPVMPPIIKYDDTQLQSNLTAAEIQAIRDWKIQYEAWQQNQKRIDPVTADRHRNAATNLALILVGLPLYLFHWGLIKKEAS